MLSNYGIYLLCGNSLTWAVPLHGFDTPNPQHTHPLFYRTPPSPHQSLLGLTMAMEGHLMLTLSWSMWSSRKQKGIFRVKHPGGSW